VLLEWSIQTCCQFQIKNEDVVQERYSRSDLIAFLLECSWRKQRRVKKMQASPRTYALETTSTKLSRAAPCYHFGLFFFFRTRYPCLTFKQLADACSIYSSSWLDLDEKWIRMAVERDRTPGPQGYRWMVDRSRASNSSGRACRTSLASEYVAHQRFRLCCSGHSFSSLVTVTW